MAEVPEHLPATPLPTREPQDALAALPAFPGHRTEVNHSGERHGEAVDRRLAPGRLHRSQPADGPGGTA